MKKLFTLGLLISISAVFCTLSATFAADTLSSSDTKTTSNPPIQVSIKAEIYQINSEKSPKMLSDTKGTGSNVFTSKLLADFRKQLTDAGGKVIGKPIISTISDCPATIAIHSMAPLQTMAFPPEKPDQIATEQDQDANIGVGVHPLVNKDRTITLSATINIPYTQPVSAVVNGETITKEVSRTIGVQFKDCIPNGDSMLSWTDSPKSTNDNTPQKRILVIFTPTII